MELDTLHDRGFYLTKAEEHPPLDDIIRGRRTLASTIDSLLCSTEPPGADFADYLRMLVGLSGYGMKTDDVMQMASCGKKRQERKTLAIGSTGGAVTAAGYIALFVSWTPLGFLFAALFAGVGMGGTLGLVEGEASLTKKRIRKRREKVLGPIRDIAGRIDNEIAALFAVEQYTEPSNNARERFEQTYPLLSDEQRQQVNTQLYAFLGAGGIPGMDEQQLNDYLGGLLVQEQDGDA